MSKGVKMLRISNEIDETFSYGIIYVYSIPFDTHKGRLKIGSATINHSEPSEEQIKAAARERIEQQTKTADVKYELEHAELAVSKKGEYFGDYDVHQVLIRSGYKRKSENVRNVRSEWFEIDLDIAKNAIRAVKEGREALTTAERISASSTEFPFRPNQKAAIEETLNAITKKRKHFLWNAKMRFGKTSAAMQVAKEAEMQKVLIVTHRPSVNADWSNDFKEIFGGTKYEFSSNNEGLFISSLIEQNKQFVYFASLQDLRLSKRVTSVESSGTEAEGFEKNEEIFDTEWDMLIVDEAHEGTQSTLGTATFSQIQTKFTLRLSGTPFNILHNHEEEDIFTWDYVMEQEAKRNWDMNNPGLPNPYAELPELSILTYDIDTFSTHVGDLGANFHDPLDGVFKFHEFFRVHRDEEGNEIAKFVHEPMVKKFLDLLVNDKLDTKFPFSTEKYRNINKHSLWLLPNRVKVIEAMENLLNEHSVFGTFAIVNISGTKKSFEEEEKEEQDAKNRVTNAIQNNKYTITLTGQRLTTGASIPEWTAVFMMSDTRSASSYLQTAFRCQTPAKIDGKIKTQGYVFDFAPDRTLRLVAEAIKLNHKRGKTNTPEQKAEVQQFLNFCPILAAEGGQMRPFNVSSMLTHLKRAIAERVYRSGFEDTKLYNDNLLQLDELAIEDFNKLRKISGKANTTRTNEIKINELGLDGSLIDQAEKVERKKSRDLTEEEKEIKEKLKEARKQKQTAVSILRAVSIRMPMLVYGADISVRQDLTLEKFLDIVDEKSWEEFMPPDLSKDWFKEKFAKYYDEDVFKGVAKSIRSKIYYCEEMLPTERVREIAEIFSTFKNPDKETVLTPWSVVNLHLTTAFGGHNFSSEQTDKAGKPVWVSKGVDTSVWEDEDTKILEINAKSGMYPLLAAYNVYTRKLKKDHHRSEDEVAKQLWSEVLENNIYVLCKSPMAKSITERTLAGYNQSIKTNIVYIENLVEKLQHKKGFEKYELKDELLAKFNLDKDMKFTAVVGNPPYQQSGEGGKDMPIYPYFYDSSLKLAEKYCLISPARFLFGAGATSVSWNNKMLNDEHLKVVYYQQNSAIIFPNTDIKGGIAILLRDSNRTFGAIKSFTVHSELGSISEKVQGNDFKQFSDLIYGVTSYTFSPKAYKDYPDLVNRVGKGSGNQLTSGIFEAAPELFVNKKTTNKHIQIFGRQNNERILKWINRDYINVPDNLNRYKVFLPAANGSGALGEVFSTPIIGEINVGHTATFISIGSYQSKNEANALLKYIKTKFVRALLGIKKTTQHNKTKEVWSKVPLQDFTKKSDIDWSKSVAEIDKQLYKKYKLDKNEIDFIESHVKEMK